MTMPNAEKLSISGSNLSTAQQEPVCSVTGSKFFDNVKIFTDNDINAKMEADQHLQCQTTNKTIDSVQQLITSNLFSTIETSPGPISPLVQCNPDYAKPGISINSNQGTDFFHSKNYVSAASTPIIAEEKDLNDTEIRGIHNSNNSIDNNANCKKEVDFSIYKETNNSCISHLQPNIPETKNTSQHCFTSTSPGFSILEQLQAQLNKSTVPNQQLDTQFNYNDSNKINVLPIVNDNQLISPNVLPTQHSNNNNNNNTAGSREEQELFLRLLLESWQKKSLLSTTISDTPESHLPSNLSPNISLPHSQYNTANSNSSYPSFPLHSGHSAQQFNTPKYKTDSQQAVKNSFNMPFLLRNQQDTTHLFSSEIIPSQISINSPTTRNNINSIRSKTSQQQKPFQQQRQSEFANHRRFKNNLNHHNHSHHSGLHQKMSKYTTNSPTDYVNNYNTQLPTNHFRRSSTETQNDVESQRPNRRINSDTIRLNDYHKSSISNNVLSDNSRQQYQSSATNSLRAYQDLNSQTLLYNNHSNLTTHFDHHQNDFHSPHKSLIGNHPNNKYAIWGGGQNNATHNIRHIDNQDINHHYTGKLNLSKKTQTFEGMDQFVSNSSSTMEHNNAESHSINHIIENGKTSDSFSGFKLNDFNTTNHHLKSNYKSQIPQTKIGEPIYTKNVYNSICSSLNQLPSTDLKKSLDQPTGIPEMKTNQNCDYFDTRPMLPADMNYPINKSGYKKNQQITPSYSTRHQQHPFTHSIDLNNHTDQHYHHHPSFPCYDQTKFSQKGFLNSHKEEYITNTSKTTDLLHHYNEDHLPYTNVIDQQTAAVSTRNFIPSPYGTQDRYSSAHHQINNQSHVMNHHLGLSQPRSIHSLPFGDTLDDTKRIRNHPGCPIRSSQYHQQYSERLYKLSICIPITIPYGIVRVTKTSGENFYYFPNDENKNARMLFSPSEGVCDAWASFLQVKLGQIFNVKAEYIPYVVDLFHTIMRHPLDPIEPTGISTTLINQNSLQKPNELENDSSQIMSKISTPVEEQTHLESQNPIRLCCQGLYPATDHFDDKINQMSVPHRPYWKNSSKPKSFEKRYETRGTFQTIDDQNKFTEIASYLKKFSKAISDVFKSLDINLEHDLTHYYSIDIIESINRFRGFLKSTVLSHNDNDSIQTNIVSSQLAHIKPISVNLAPYVIEKSVRDTRGLPIIIKEYGQIENKELEFNLMNNIEFAQSHAVENIELSEIRLEHQSKKMVDPRFGKSLVLTRQMAGDENPESWNDSKKQQLQGNASSIAQGTEHHTLLKQQSDVEIFNKTGISDTHHKEHSIQNITDPKDNQVHDNLLKIKDQISELQTTLYTNKKFIQKIGRYEFCQSPITPHVDVAYSDATDCLLSSHGFIYIRHLLSLQQSNSA